MENKQVWRVLISYRGFLYQTLSETDVGQIPTRQDIVEKSYPDICVDHVNAMHNSEDEIVIIRIETDALVSVL